MVLKRAPLSRRKPHCEDCWPLCKPRLIRSAHMRQSVHHCTLRSKCRCIFLQGKVCHGCAEFVLLELRHVAGVLWHDLLAQPPSSTGGSLYYVFVKKESRAVSWSTMHWRLCERCLHTVEEPLPRRCSFCAFFLKDLLA